MVLTHAMLLSSDLLITELVVPLAIVTKLAAEPGRPMENVLKGIHVSTVVPPVELSHVDMSISVVLGVRTRLTCCTFPVGPIGIDSESRESTVPLDWLVPSGVPEYVLT